MPYFIILPGYLLLLLFLAVAVVVTHCVTGWRASGGYIIGGAVGTLPGFIVANIAVILAGILPVLIAQHLNPPQWLQQGLGIVAAVILLLGPFVASGIGVVFGFMAGVYFVFRRRRVKRFNRG